MGDMIKNMEPAYYDWVSEEDKPEHIKSMCHLFKIQIRSNKEEIAHVKRRIKDIEHSIERVSSEISHDSDPFVSMYNEQIIRSQRSINEYKQNYNDYRCSELTGITADEIENMEIDD